MAEPPCHRELAARCLAPCPTAAWRMVRVAREWSARPRLVGTHRPTAGRDCDAPGALPHSPPGAQLRSRRVSKASAGRVPAMVCRMCTERHTDRRPRRASSAGPWLGCEIRRSRGGPAHCGRAFRKRRSTRRAGAGLRPHAVRGVANCARGAIRIRHTPRGHRHDGSGDSLCRGRARRPVVYRMAPASALTRACHLRLAGRRRHRRPWPGVDIGDAARRARRRGAAGAAADAYPPAGIVVRCATLGAAL